MNVELKERLIAALRDGDYKQGRWALRTANDEFCCLGVLCDLVSPDDWKLNGSIYIHRNAASMPRPEILVELLGYGKPGYYANYGFIESLAAKNDNGSSFAEIARMIEDHDFEMEEVNA